MYNSADTSGWQELQFAYSSSPFLLWPFSIFKRTALKDKKISQIVIKYKIDRGLTTSLHLPTKSRWKTRKNNGLLNTFFSVLKAKPFKTQSRREHLASIFYCNRRKLLLSKENSDKMCIQFFSTFIITYFTL